jgi:ankyrin repeat protein
MDHDDDDDDDDSTSHPLNESSAPTSPIPRKRHIASSTPPNKHLRVDAPLPLPLPLAPSIEAFCKDNSSSSQFRYQPRPEWFRGDTDTDTDTDAVIFGHRDHQDSALHFCIRHGYSTAALRLLFASKSLPSPLCFSSSRFLVNAETSKGVTPLVLAAQKGMLVVVHELKGLGANLAHATANGATAVLQAAHFGHLQVVRYLVQDTATPVVSGSSNTVTITSHRRLLELANYHQTTPLMRASQEGHLPVVQYLVQSGALVNRKNRQSMTALMLASQRGHASVCQYLIQHGGADVDTRTTQAHSTSLVLACKRQHVDTVQVLVTAGCELYGTDARGRTARDICLQRHGSTTSSTTTTATTTATASTGGPNSNTSITAAAARKLLGLLDATVQMELMRRKSRRDRSYAWMRIYTLLQQDRARVRGAEDVPLTVIGSDAMALVEQRRTLRPSSLAWIRTLALLPAPLVQAICEFAPLPSCWDRRIGLLTKRCLVDANAALESGLDLMDEVLEEGGFLQALDQALVPPPLNFHSWVRTRFSK